MILHIAKSINDVHVVAFSFNGEDYAPFFCSEEITTYDKAYEWFMLNFPEIITQELLCLKMPVITKLNKNFKKLCTS